MAEHRKLDTLLSISRGSPLSEEPGIGALTLGGFLKEVVANHGPKEAAVLREGDNVERWSYNDLWDRSLEVAKALVACGVGKGTRVGILMTNRLEFLSATFGTALAGGVTTTLSTFSTSAELDILLKSSACSVLLLEKSVLKKDFVAMLGELEPNINQVTPGDLRSEHYPFLRVLAAVDINQNAGGIEDWNAFLARGQDTPTALVEACAASVMPADPGVLFFSSGSTGKPKGILSAHRGVCLQLWRWRKWYRFEEGLRSWSANGFFWSGNFALGIGGALSAGGSLILQRTFDPEEALELMAIEKATFLFAWPHQWAQLTGASNWLDVDLSALKFIDADSPIAAHPTINTTYKEPAQAYGNTETFTLSSVYPANTPADVTAGSHGVPVEGNIFKITDPITGEIMPLGQSGEIAVKGPTLMLGYLGVPLDETLDDEGFFHTGDGGYIDEQGRIFWAGRINDIIKTGGANVSPIEIDGVIAKCPGVKVTKTVGIPDELLGEMVVTCIVPHIGVSLDEAKVRNFAKEVLASYKVPRRVLFMEESDLELTGSAKIKSSDIIELAKKRLQSEA